MSNVTLPARGAFYYPWYPETWKVGGCYPHRKPVLGYYDSSAVAVVDQHIRWLDYIKADVAIASWWGVDTHQEASRIPLLLERTAALGSSLKWCVYYEKESQGDPTPSIIAADLAYLERYASSPQWAIVDGKPVIFAYAGGADNCSMSERWAQGAPGWYVVLKVFGGFADCASQPDEWHQYGPAKAEQHIPGHSFSISPGFWKADSPTPRLTRDPARFKTNAANMVASGEPWQLITTFNEWGEGTNVEDSTRWASKFRDILAAT